MSSSLSIALQHFQRGDLARAEQETRRALSSNPNDPEALNLLAAIATRAGNLTAAIEILTHAIAQHPSLPKLYLNRGEACRNANDLDRALDDYRKAIALDSNYALAFFNLGLALRSQEKLDEAIDAYRNAVRIKPDYAKAHYNLGNAHRARLEFDDAECAYRAAVAIDPNYAEAWNNLGEMLMERMRIDDAQAALSRAIELRPDHAGAQFNRAFLRLLQGDYERAWDNYEWRWKAQRTLPPRDFAQPVWDGSDLSGKMILLHAEQGVGDTIQFIRYAPMVKSRGAARVIVECQASVATLIETVRGVDEVVSQGSALPPFDVHIPILSLPRVFRTTLETIPTNVPYLIAATQRVARFRELIAPHRRALNVGLAWAGNPVQPNDRNRSAKLNALAPLFENADDIRFCSLQKGSPALSENVIDLSPHLNDFADTAAAIENLDVIVSVCTSVAHVAGALAKPTIAMLCFNADWRWLLDREDSPWYPTTKLVRQTTQGDWSDVARRARTMLFGPKPDL